MPKFWIFFLLELLVGKAQSKSDHQALQSIKHHLYDPNGFLHSWNLAPSGTCSGGWVGIQCVGGRVVAIHLPFKSLAGRISDSIGRLSALRKLSLHDNAIGGPILPSLALLPCLRAVYLFNNRLSGPIPPTILNHPNLQTIDLRNNSLVGPIDFGFLTPNSLHIVDLGFNALSGPLPLGLTRSNSLTRISLRHNRLSGPIPNEWGSIGDLPKLSLFDVSDNSLSGPVPAALSARFSSSSFRGNARLCGYSASVPCPSPSVASYRGRQSAKKVILIASGAVSTLLLLCFALLCFYTSRQSGAPRQKGAVAKVGKLVHFEGVMAFTAEELLCATAEVMGKNAYGTMYKATMVEEVVAVKRLREGIGEFETKVGALRKVRHRNLVPLRAYYLGPKGEKLLVFDFMPRGSLAALLHARGPDTPIDWRTRYRNGDRLGAAPPPHQSKHHHGNLTSGNVLLDEHLNPKISDFGLSRLIATTSALSYATPENDVYSLGVIVLELLTGKSPGGEAVDGVVGLPQWVASAVREEWTSEVFDAELVRGTAAEKGELLDALNLALHCVDPSPAARPNVRQVVQRLEEIRPEMAAVDD
ncbi:putative leucine-rich repeat receptor-like protein kinase IMK3 [Acorus calamus]|uniref:Leucine-rich repeat receptor-like protein kinase IMK3 n=1 Tax=Acorus calamus TaxID=4465 RepID=A0AAV9C510_ACOCL|nr:putative leucine-rich repeat receptor-like protein kinase IMK3 [Acorus calamus]